MTEIDEQTDDHWEADRVAFCAEPPGADWDRCGVAADGPLARRFSTLAATLLDADSWRRR
ncbi:hypothetical protein ACWEVP_17950 [Amycolatopsis sp. NPDC003865]